MGRFRACDDTNPCRRLQRKAAERAARHHELLCPGIRVKRGQMSREHDPKRVQSVGHDGVQTAAGERHRCQRSHRLPVRLGNDGDHAKCGAGEKKRNFLDDSSADPLELPAADRSEIEQQQHERQRHERLFRQQAATQSRARNTPTRRHADLWQYARYALSDTSPKNRLNTSLRSAIQATDSTCSGWTANSAGNEAHCAPCCLSCGETLRRPRGRLPRARADW